MKEIFKKLLFLFTFLIIHQNSIKSWKNFENKDLPLYLDSKKIKKSQKYFAPQNCKLIKDFIKELKNYESHFHSQNKKKKKYKYKQFFQKNFRINRR